MWVMECGVYGLFTHVETLHAVLSVESTILFAAPFKCIVYIKYMIPCMRHIILR